MTQFTSGARSVRPSEPRPLQRGSPAVFYQAPPTPTPHPLQVHFGCYRAGGWVGGCERRQMLSTKLPGNRPVLPLRCSVPLNQPSSRFLCTNTMSPSLSSSSASLCGGYDTTTRYLSHMMGRASCCWDWREEQG